jgi:SPP1 family predicted phage head-tail adaptor
MRAGKLNSRVLIQQQSTTQDALGQPVQTWTDLTTVWASIVHVSGIEAVKADALTSTVRASIQIRYNSAITAGMRAVSGATTYSIIAVLPDMARKEYVNLACEVL